MDFNKIEQSRRFSYVGQYSSTNYTYALQYKQAFDTLYESSDAVDSIALPMMFLMRHYLELILKTNIIYFSQYSESNFMVEKINDEHKLKPLANAFQEHWNIVVKKYELKVEYRQYIKDLKNFIELVDELDKYSMSFRYSHNKKKDSSFVWDDTLDIANIKKSLEEVLPFLQYSMDIFHSQVIELE